jgi:two-component system invasion response regulator UvrY
MLRFLIADDHTIIRKGLMQILLDAFPSCFVEGVADAEDMYKKVMTEVWDVLITDISMPGRSGLEVLEQIRQSFPKLPILVLSIYSEDQYALRVLKAGASGYLTKNLAPEELVKAINQVLLGKKYITPSIAEKLANVLLQGTSEKSPHECLSDREFEVLKLLASGKSVSDIAEKLSLGASTISTYKARIMTKMTLKTNADLTLYAIENKLL